MSTIKRRLPQSNLARQLALNKAKGKNDALPPGSPVVFNPATETRLNAQAPVYNSGLQNVGNKQADLSVNTPAKDALIETVRLFTSHFFQVFNLGVRRGKYPAGHRAHYQLDVNSDAVPNLDSDENALAWSLRLGDGDAARLAAGGVAMANPDAAEVLAANTPAVTSFELQSNLADALDTAQEAVDDLNEEADSLIRRAWDEVEAFFGEEEAESKRANAREWGVVYVTEGAQNTLTGLAKNAGGVPQEGATVTIIESGAETAANNEGRYNMNTSLTGLVTLRADIGALTGQVQVTIPEDAEDTTIEVGDIVVA